MKPLTTLPLLIGFILYPITAYLQLNNDVGLSKDNVIIPDLHVNYHQVFDGFPIGATIYNYGTNNLDSIYVSISVIDAQTAILHSETLGPFSINVGDSLEVYNGNTIQFSLFNPTVNSFLFGEFELIYELSLLGDQDSSNNLLSFPFALTDENEITISHANIDANGHLISQAYPKLDTASHYRACMFWQEANTLYGGQALCALNYVDLIQHVDSGQTLLQTELFVNVYEWNDSWVNLSDTSFSTPNAAFQDIPLVSFGAHYPNTDLEIDSMITVLLDFPFYPIINQRYLVCAETFESKVTFGFDTTVNYKKNETIVKNPTGVVFANSTWQLSNPDLGTPSISPGFSCFSWGLNEQEPAEVTVFPNPSEDYLQFTLNEVGYATLEIIDFHGRIVFNKGLELLGEIEVVNIQTLRPGLYTLLIKSDSGKRYMSRFTKR